MNFTYDRVSILGGAGGRVGLIVRGFGVWLTYSPNLVQLTWGQVT